VDGGMDICFAPKLLVSPILHHPADVWNMVRAVANAGYESQASTAVPGEETYQRLISLRLSVPVGHRC